MFKIKVGLKSFQTHSMQRCKHQIGYLVFCLKQSQTSFYPNLEKKDGFLPGKQEGGSTCFPIGKSATTGPNSYRKLAPHLNLPPMRKEALTGSLKNGGELLVLHMQNKCDVGVNQRFAKTTTLSIKSKRLRRRADLSNKKINKGETSLRDIPLPTLVKKITMLRSPHIDKKSREQFEWKRQKARISFDLNSAPQISFVLSVLTHSRFPGVEIEIGVESKTYFM